MVIAGWDERESGLLHFLAERARVHFANCVSRQIDFAKYGTRGHGSRDAENHVPIRQQLHSVWSVALSCANIVVPDRVPIPVGIKTLNCVGSGREYIEQLNSVV